MDPIEERLEHERPIPSAAFRGDLRRHLLAGREPATASRARLNVLAYAGSGGLLMVVAAVSVLGAGPLAA